MTEMKATGDNSLPYAYKNNRLIVVFLTLLCYTVCMKKDNLKHARTCMYNINYHIVCSVKCRRKMYEKFPDLRQQLWKGELWNHSYYLETIGDISEETIRKYIEHQSKQY